MYANIENMSKQQQAKNAGIYMVPTIISMILPLISIPIILSYLSPIEFGAYTISFAFGSVVAGFCQISLLGVYERNFFLYNKNKERAQLLFTILSFVSFVMLMSGLLIYNFRSYISSWIIQSNEYSMLLFITFAGVAFQSGSNYYLSYLKNMGNAKLNVSIVLLTSILGFILNVFFVSILKIGPIGLSFGLLISNAVVFAVVTIYFLKLLGYKINFSFLVSSLKLSVPLVPTGIFAIVGKYFDKYILSVLSSIGSVGIYAISQRISNLSFLFMTNIQKVYGPIVYAKMFKNKDFISDNEIGKYLTPFAYFSVASALFLSLFSEEAIIILAPQEYLKGLSAINLLCISFAFTFFSKQPQLMYAGKTGIQSVLSFINFTCKIIVLYIFVNLYGLTGAAAGVLIVTIFYNILLVWQGQKYFKINYEWIKLIIIYLTLILMSISVLFLFEWGYEYHYRFIIKNIFFGLFIVLGIKLNIITKKNIFLVFKKTTTEK